MSVSAQGIDVKREPLVGISLKLASVCSFMVMNSVVKAAGDVPAGQIVFFRSLFALLPIIVLLSYQRELKTAFYTSRPLSHFLRGFVGVASMMLTFIAITHLPLPDAITLGYAQPLFVVVFSALFLGETVRMYRWSAVAIGFVGVVILAWPGLTLLRGHGLSAGEAAGVLAALGGALMSACAMMLVRRLVSTEKTSTIVIWFSTTSSIVALATLPFGWAALNQTQVFLLITAGIFGGIGQLFLTHSYRFADLSTIAPFEYTSIILAVVIGYFVFGDVPTLYMLVGGTIVAGSGLFIIWRERQLGVRQVTSKSV